jgi:hypothetical protein
MAIDYPANKSFELRVKDKGELEQFDVFVNGTLRSHISDGEMHKFPLERPPSAMAIAVHFEGQDGGKSAIVDVTDPQNPVKIASQDGLLHSYIVRGV